MANPQIQADPVYSIPFSYKQGLTLAWGSNTTLTIAAGQCRDSSGNIDIPLGSAPLNGVTITAPLTLNAAVVGAGGIDTGALAASKMYAVYMIADSHYNLPISGIITLATNSSPLLPSGYDSSRLIGYWPTNASSQFLLGYVSGNGATLLFTYDAPQATAITAGSATTYTAIDLTGLVPALDNIPVLVQATITPSVAGQTLKLQPAGATGDAVTIVGQVAMIALTQTNIVDAKLASSLAKIAYKVSAAGAAAAINVAGFYYFV
jgi:hypothetical protein